MRGSTPLDVAAASVMDNNELALALEEPDLDKVSDHFDLFTYLLKSATREKGEFDRRNFWIRSPQKFMLQVFSVSR